MDRASRAWQWLHALAIKRLIRDRVNQQQQLWEMLHPRMTIEQMEQRIMLSGGSNEQPTPVVLNANLSLLLTGGLSKLQDLANNIDTNFAARSIQLPVLNNVSSA